MYFGDEIKRTVSYKEKVKRKYARQRKLMEMYNMYFYNADEEKDRQKRIKTNYNLLNGIVDEEKYNSPLNLAIQGQEVDLGYAYVQHYPLIAKISEAAIGEEILLPFKLSVLDTSRGATNARKREKEKRLEEYLNITYLEPARQQILLREFGPEFDPSALPQEQVRQFMASVEEEVKAMTPDEIDEYIENEFKSIEEIQGQKLVNYLEKELDLKRKKNEAFEDAFAIAEEYYLVGINHDRPFFSVLNPAYVEWAPTPGKPWIQDAMYALYREEVSIQEAFARDGEYLEKADIKKLSELVHGHGFNARYPDELTDADEQVIFELHKDPSIGEKYSPIDLHTQEGQDKMVKLYDEVLQGGLLRHGDMFLTRTYIAWRDMAYFKRVKRKNIETGEITYHWKSEDYIKNPALGDLEVKRVEKPEVWHGVVYGYGEDSVYIKIEPVPNQRSSFDNIHEVKLPFFGGKLNTRKGNADNRSNIDYGIPWNFEFDIQMAELKLKQATNFGRVFTMIKELKPENIPWKDWINTMKYLKLLILETNREDLEIDPQWANFLHGVDLSTVNDIAAAINLLQFTITNLADQMHFSQERLGRIGQYMTASTSKDAINASEVQTTRLYNNHNYIFTQAVQYLLDVTRTAFKNNPPLKARILDDISQAELDLDFEMLARSELGVFISISPTDIQKVKEIKLRTQEIIQNQMLDIEDLFKFEMADTPAELMNLGAAISKKRQEMQALAEEKEQERVQLMIQQELAKQDKQFQEKLALQKMKDISDERTAMIDATKFAATLDINKNQVSDSKEINDDKLDWEREKFYAELDDKKADRIQRERELDIREKEVEAKKAEPKKKSSDKK